MRQGSRLFAIICGERRARIFEIGHDYALSPVKELAFGQRIVRVVEVNEEVVFGIANGIQVYSPSTWSITFEAEFDLAVTNLRVGSKTVGRKDQLIIALGSKDRSVVLILEDLTLKARIELKSPLLDLFSGTDGCANQFPHFV